MAENVVFFRKHAVLNVLAFYLVKHISHLKGHTSSNLAIPVYMYYTTTSVFFLDLFITFCIFQINIIW